MRAVRYGGTLMWKLRFYSLVSVLLGLTAVIASLLSGIDRVTILWTETPIHFERSSYWFLHDFILVGIFAVSLSLLALCVKRYISLCEKFYKQRQHGESQR